MNINTKDSANENTNNAQENVEQINMDEKNTVKSTQNTATTNDPAYDIEQALKKHTIKCDDDSHNDELDSQVEFNENGEIIGKHSSKDGVKNGETIHYEDGKIAQRIFYKDGKINGPVETYQNGILNMIIHYKDDVPDGPIYLFVNSELSQMGKNKAGQKHGTFFIFSSGYLIKEEIYNENLLHGKSITYYPESNDIFEIGNYMYGEKSGVWKKYDPQGQLIDDEEF